MKREGYSGTKMMISVSGYRMRDFKSGPALIPTLNITGDSPEPARELLENSLYIPKVINQVRKNNDIKFFIQAQVKPEDVPRVLPSRDGYEIKFRFMQAVAKLAEV